MVLMILKYNLLANMNEMKTGQMILTLEWARKWLTIGRPASRRHQMQKLDLVLGAAGTPRDQEVEAQERDYRTPCVPSPNVAETDGSVVVEAIEPEVEADTQESDMFASAVSVADSEFAVPLVADPEVPIPLPPPPPPVPD
eukprot:3759980-Amphidinium_carterae.2